MKCAQCEQEFDSIADNQLYCSGRCKRVAARRRQGVQPFAGRRWSPGDRFGRLVLVARTKVGKRQFWSCRCDCGRLFEARADKLKDGRQQSCGCLKEEKLRAALKAREENFLQQSEELKKRRVCEPEQTKPSAKLAKKHESVCFILKLVSTSYSIDNSKNPLWSIRYYEAVIQDGCHYCKKDLYLETGASLHEIVDEALFISEPSTVVPCCSTCFKRRFEYGDQRDETLSHEEMEVLGQTLELIRLRRQVGHVGHQDLAVRNAQPRTPS